MTEKNLSQKLRNVVLAGVVGFNLLVNPIHALACGEKTFLDVLNPIIQNPQIMRIDQDKLIYARFDSGLDDINEISTHPEDYNLTSSSSLEPLYGTLEEAMKNIESSTRYIAEINVGGGIRHGLISKVYTRDGKELQGRAIYRCLNSPLEFSE